MTEKKPKGKLMRWVVVIIAGLLVICIAAATLSAVLNRRLPTQSEPIEHLGELDKARLAELQNQKSELGDQVWPGWGKFNLPIILYNESYAFLVAYPGSPPDGWVNVRTGEIHGGPWEIVPGDSYAGGEYYRQSLPSEDDTPQAFTVRVGDLWTVSMTTKDWTQIKLASMIKEQLPPPISSIFPYGIYTGVFNSDWHISAVMHEGFHAFQGTFARTRLEKAEESTTYQDRYPWDDPELENAWQQELDTLADALLTGSDIEVKELAGEFLALRQSRRSRFYLEDELADYERQREWLEGLSKYIELESWRQAAVSPGYQALSIMAEDPGFNNYDGFDAQWKREVAQMKRMAGDEGDGRFYYSGMAQAVLLDRLMPGWKELALQEGVFLEDLLLRAVSIE